jgi:TRAP-type C4-dicarboxylate transport system substrate-binding protein
MRSFYNARRPLKTPADLVGLRIRVQEGGIMEALASSYGAAPVTMAFGESYSAILRGSVDGAENNIPTYYSSRHYQVAKYYTLTEHVRIPEMVVGSALGFRELSAADRELIAKAAMDSSDFQRKAWRAYEAMAAEKLREAGVSMIRPADPEAWRALAERLYPSQDPEIRALVARIKAAK